MSVKLSNILSEIVNSSAPAELKEVKEDLEQIITKDGHHTLKDCLGVFVNDNGLLLSDTLIASEHNQISKSNLYYDHLKESTFSIDFETFSATHQPSSAEVVERPAIYQDLVSVLEQYGQEYYPSRYGFTVIPISEDTLKIVIMGQKDNKANFYAGVWKSVYIFDESGAAKGDVSVDIHYYEDGNVRLGFKESCEESSNIQFTPDHILSYIKKAESSVISTILNDFALLNQNYFKSLRRLLPVTKSKVNWGKAIGTYRLGSDVVDKN